MKKLFFVIVIAIVVFSVWFNWLRPEKHETFLSIERTTYGDYYNIYSNLDECRIYNRFGKYINSINCSSDMSENYFWWVPEKDSGITYKNALDMNNINAVWTLPKFEDMFGTDVIVGTEWNKIRLINGELNF